MSRFTEAALARAMGLTARQAAASARSLSRAVASTLSKVVGSARRVIRRAALRQRPTTTPSRTLQRDRDKTLRLAVSSTVALTALFQAVAARIRRFLMIIG